MWMIGGSDKFRQAMEEAVRKVQMEAALLVGDLDKVADLKKKLANMEIEHGKKVEGWDRREREIEHKIGLERKRQEFEIEQAKRETTVKVREENLTADKERFKAEMEFQRERLSGEVDALRKLVDQMLQRLPSAEIIANFGAKK